MTETVVLNTRALIPAPWERYVGDAPIYAFNPSLIQGREAWVLAYRLVLGDGLRRIAFCLLDKQLVPIPGSATPFSDLVRFANEKELSYQALHWFADPRLVRLMGRSFVSWNSGWHEPRNHQFLQEFDTSTLQPLGPPRELCLKGSRQPIEKNWAFWEADGLYASYSPSPHKVLGFSLDGEGPLLFHPLTEQAWGNGIYERRFGFLRGGTPPVRDGERFVAICHSMHGSAESGFDYKAAAYSFSAKAPFVPIQRPHRPLPLPDAPQRSLPVLNKAVGQVIYPCGLARDAGDWLLSYGLHDEYCVVARLSEAKLAASLIPCALPRT